MSDPEKWRDMSSRDESFEHEPAESENEHDVTILDMSKVADQSAEQYANFNDRLSNQIDLISRLQLRMGDYKKRMVQMSKVGGRSASQPSTSSGLRLPDASPRAPFGDLPNVTFSPRLASTPRNKTGAWDPIENFQNLSKQLDERERLLIELNDTLRDDLEEARLENDDLKRQNSRLAKRCDAAEKSRLEIEEDSDRRRRNELACVTASKAKHEKLLSVWKSLNDLRPYMFETRSILAEKFAQLSTQIHGISVVSQGALQKFSLRLNYERAMNQIASGSEPELTIKLGSGTIEDMMTQNLQHVRQIKSKFDAEKQQLKAKITELETQNRDLKADLDQKSASIDRQQSKRHDESSSSENFNHLEQIFGDLAHHIESSPSGRVTVDRRSRSLSPAAYRIKFRLRDQSPVQPEIDSMIRSVYNAVDRKNADFEDLKNRLEKCQEHVSMLNKRLDEAEVDKKESEKQIERLRDQLSVSNKEKDSEKSKLDRLSLQLTQLQAEKSALQVQRDSMKSNLDQINVDLNKNRSEFFELKRQNCKLEDDRVQIMEELEKLKADNERSQAIASNLQSQFVVLKADGDAKERELQLVKANLQKSSFDLENAQKNLAKSQELNGNLKEQLRQSEEEISGLKNKHNALKQKASNFKRQIEQLEEQLHALESAKLEQSRNMEKDGVELRRLMQENESLQSAVKDNELEKTVLVAQVDKLNSYIADLEAKLTDGRKKFLDLEAQRQNALQRLQQAETESDQLKSDLSKNSADFIEFQGENRKILKEFENKLVGLEDECDRQKVSLDEMHAEKRKLLTSIDKLSRKNQESNDQLKAANQSIDNLDKEKAALEESVKNLRESLSASTDKYRQERQTLTQRIESQEKAIAHMNQQILILEDENSAFQSQLAEQKQSFDAEKTDLEQRYAKNLDGLKKTHQKEAEDYAASLNDLKLTLQQTKFDYENEFKALEQKMRNETEELRAQKSDLENRLSISKSQLAEMETSLKNLHSQLESKEIEHSAQSERQNTKIQELEINLERVEQRALDEEKRLSEEKEALRIDLDQVKGQMIEVRQKNQSLKNRLSETDAQYDQTKRALEKLNSELESERSRCQEIEPELLQLRSTVEDLRKNYYTSEQDRLNFVEQLTQKEVQCEGLASQNKKLAHDLEDKSKDLLASKLQLDQISADLGFFKQKVRELESELKSNQTLIHELKTTKEKLTKKEDGLQLELNSAKEKLVACEVKLNDYAIDNKNLQTSLIQLKEEFQRKNQEDRLTIDDLRVSLQNVEQSRGQLSDALQDARRRFVEISDKLSAANQNAAQLSGRSDAVADQLRSREEQLRRIGSALRKLYSEEPNLGRTVGLDFAELPSIMADDDLANATFGADRLEGHLQRLLQSYSMTAKEKEALDSKTQALEKQLECVLKEKSSAEGVIVEMKFKLDEFEEERKTLEFRIDSMQSLLVAQEEAIRTRNNEKSQLISQINQLELKERSRESLIKKLEVDLAEVEESRQSLIGKLQRGDLQYAQLECEKQSLESALLDQSQEIDKLRGSTKRDEVDKAKLEQDLKTCLDKLRKMDHELSQMSAENNKLKSEKMRLADVELSLKQQIELAQCQVQEKYANEGEMREKLIIVQQACKQLEQDKHLLEERLEDMKDHLAKLKRDSREKTSSLDESNEIRVALDAKCKEAEIQLKAAQKLLAERQQIEIDLRRRLDLIGEQKSNLAEQMQSLQHRLNALQGEKSEWDVVHLKLERECTSLRRQLKELEKDKRKSDHLVNQLNAERAAVDKAISAIEKENMTLHNTVQQFQLQLTTLEQQHAQKIFELSQNEKSEAEFEINRLRVDKQNLERTLEFREKLHNNRHKALDDQIIAVKEQLQYEKRRDRRSESAHSTKGSSSQAGKSASPLYTDSQLSGFHKSHRRLKFDTLPEK